MVISLCRKLGALIVAITLSNLTLYAQEASDLELQFVVFDLSIAAPDSVSHDYIKMLVPEIKPGSRLAESEIEPLLTHLENRLKHLNISYQVSIVAQIDESDRLLMHIEIGDGFFHSFGFKGSTLAVHYGYKNLFDDFIATDVFLGLYEQSISVHDPAIGLSPWYYRFGFGHENNIIELGTANVEFGLTLIPDIGLGIKQSAFVFEKQSYFETRLILRLFEDSWIEHRGLRLRATIEPTVVYDEKDKALKFNTLAEQRLYVTPDISLGCLEGLGFQTMSRLLDYPARVLDLSYLGSEVSTGQELRLEGRASLRFDKIFTLPVFGISNFTVGFEPLYQVKCEKYPGSMALELQQGVGALLILGFSKPIGIAFKLGVIADLQTTKASASFYFTQEDL